MVFSGPREPIEVQVFRGRFVHTFYWEQLASCPVGFKYDLEPNNDQRHGIKSDLRAPRWPVVASIRERMRRVAIGARAGIAVPNARVCLTTADLVHSFQYALVGPRKWVIDLEDVSALVGYEPFEFLPAHSRAMTRALLLQRSCCAILPWTKASASSIRAVFPELATKLRVVYPAMAPGKIDWKQVETRGRRLLFVGSAFVSKGGIHLLRAFSRVRNEFPDATLDIVSFVPAALREEAQRIGGIRLHQRVSAELLGSLYARARCLVAPFCTDTLGFVVFEAFARAVPTVVVDNFALAEIVDDARTGLVAASYTSAFLRDGRRRFRPVPPPHDRSHGHPLLDELAEPPQSAIDDLASKLCRLLEDGTLATSMAKAAHAEVSSGRFSHHARCRALAEVYSGALKSTFGTT